MNQIAEGIKEEVKWLWNTLPSQNSTECARKSRGQAHWAGGGKRSPEKKVSLEPEHTHLRERKRETEAWRGQEVHPSLITLNEVLIKGEDVLTVTKSETVPGAPWTLKSSTGKTWTANSAQPPEEAEFQHGEEVAFMSQTGWQEEQWANLCEDGTLRQRVHVKSEQTGEGNTRKISIKH